MKVTARQFQREFSRMKAKALSGETVIVISEGRKFLFKEVRRPTWQKSLKGKGEIKDNLFSTGIVWESAQ